MYPVLFKPFGVPINSYGLAIAIGFLTALFFILRDARKFGLDEKVVSDAAFYMLPLGVFGTRLLHIIMFPDGYSWSDPVGWVALWKGGLVFQGGPPIAIGFLYWYLRKHKVDFWRACDVAFPYLALAHGFGRIGCFMYGCCYGAPTNVPWAIPFRRVPWDTALPPTGSPAYLDHLQRFGDMTLESHWSHAIHPTQLYSFVGLITICGLMLFLRKRWYPYVGFTMPVYFVIYGLFRFIVEFFRGDGNPSHMLGLTDQQIFSVIFAFAGVIFFFILRTIQSGQKVEVDAP